MNDAAVVGAGGPPGLAFALENADGCAASCQGQRRRKSGDTTADDRDIDLGHHTAVTVEAFGVRTACTASKTSSTVISCMQRLLSHGDRRWLNTLTHGLHASCFQMIVVAGDSDRNSSGVSGPNSTTVWTDVSDAKCAGPLSLVTRTLASV